MFRKASLFVAILLLVPIVAACSSTTTTSTTTVAQTVTVPVTTTVVPTVTNTLTSTVTAITIAPPPTTATGTPTTTAGGLAALGESKYEADCTFTYCHASFGPRGADGALNSTPADVAFGKTAMSFFGNAQSYFVFIKSFMHHPDTVSFLTDDDYVQIIAYLLVQNGTLTSSAPFGLSNLSTTLLKP